MNLGVAASRQSAANMAVLEWRRSTETPLRFKGSKRDILRGNLTPKDGDRREVASGLRPTSRQRASIRP